LPGKHLGPLKVALTGESRRWLLAFTGARWLSQPAGEFGLLRS